MARFENSMGISSIEIPNKKCHCFCTIGKKWCTYQFAIAMEPDAVIPDYLEVEQYMEDNIEGQQMTIEVAVTTVADYIANEYKPKYLQVSVYCDDAKHFPVNVTVIKESQE